MAELVTLLKERTFGELIQVIQTGRLDTDRFFAEGDSGEEPVLHYSLEDNIIEETNEMFNEIQVNLEGNNSPEDVFEWNLKTFELEVKPEVVQEMKDILHECWLDTPCKHLLGYTRRQWLEMHPGSEEDL